MYAHFRCPWPDPAYPPHLSPAYPAAPFPPPHRVSRSSGTRRLSVGTVELGLGSSSGLSVSQQEETTHPDQQPVLDDQSVGDDILPAMNDDTLQQLLESNGTSSPVRARGDSFTGSPEAPPFKEQAPSASQSLDSEEPHVDIQRIPLMKVYRYRNALGLTAK
ncbi:uncharacterized protein LOC144819948 [Lissotriton helveticus]